jgi:hypothetical protein
MLPGWPQLLLSQTQACREQAGLSGHLWQIYKGGQQNKLSGKVSHTGANNAASKSLYYVQKAST